MKTTILDIIEEMLQSYEDDEDIETKILQDLKDNIEVELYERTTTLDYLSEAFDNPFDDDAY